VALFSGVVVTHTDVRTARRQINMAISCGGYKSGLASKPRDKGSEAMSSAKDFSTIPAPFSLCNDTQARNREVF
jgi:hypothetical protein